MPSPGRARNSSMERETGFEPATSTLARSHSTTELLPLSSRHYKRGVEAGQSNGSNTLRLSARLGGRICDRTRKAGRLIPTRPIQTDEEPPSGLVLPHGAQSIADPALAPRSVRRACG
jgi:hypothetical protein